jgi:hypothetical protein
MKTKAQRDEAARVEAMAVRDAMIALAAAEAARDLAAIDEILAPQNYFDAGVVLEAFAAHERVRALLAS